MDNVAFIQHIAFQLANPFTIIDHISNIISYDIILSIPLNTKAFKYLKSATQCLSIVSALHLTGQESCAEERFLAMLVESGFPPPDSDQYKINLGGSSYTVADYAYTDAKVAIYIDGLSKNLHGDPTNKVKDRRLRAVLIEKGWKPLVISSEGLKDSSQFNDFLETIRAAIE